MNVVTLSILVSIVILIPYSISQINCPARNTNGCYCGYKSIGCNSDYAGDEIPNFIKSNELFTSVMMEWTAVRIIQPFVLLNIRTKGLDLAYNKIYEVDPKAFWTSELNKTSTHSALTRLDLQSNNIYSFNGGIFDSLINLETINLSNNKLSNKHHLYMVYIPHIIINLHRLRYFFISNNKLSSLHNKWLPANLLYLDISENQIVAIHNKTFAGAPKLSVIKLSLNNIMYIEYNTFSNLGSIRLVNPGELKPCTCKYVWYLNTNSNSIVCDNSYNKYPSIREYLREDCKQHIPGNY